MTDFPELRVEQIHIENVYGVRELKFDPDGVALVRGDNDTGKTSVLKAINLLLTGGQDMDALHKDAESGRVEFQLSDGTRVWASLTESRIHYKVDGHPELTARQLLTALQDEVSINPIQILRARPRDRGEILLEAMPMRVEREDVEDYLAPVPEIRRSMDWEHMEEQHALEVLGDSSSGLIGTLYQERQKVGGVKRDKKGTVNDLEDAVGDHEEPGELKEDREQVQREIDDLQAQKEDEIERINAWEAAEIEKIRDEATGRRSQAREEHESKITRLESQRERLNERIEQAERAQQTVETLNERRGELKELKTIYESLTESIEALRSLRTDFQDELPSGVTVDEDGEIVNEEGIRFEHWNEQSQVQFALRIAEMRMGELPLIPLDGIENVVGRQRKELIRFCRESPAQFILTEAVPDEKLSVVHPDS